MKIIIQWTQGMLKPWVMALYAIVALLTYVYFDRPIAIYFHDLHVEERISLMRAINFLGEGSLYMVGFFVAAVFFRWVKKNPMWEARSWIMWINVTSIMLVCGVLKMCLGRARPVLLFSEHQFGFYGFHLQHAYWSCPSGHTCVMMALLLGGVLFWPRYVYLFLLMALSFVFTRVMVTAHYLSDVLVSMYGTLLFGSALIQVSKNSPLFKRMRVSL